MKLCEQEFRASELLSIYWIISKEFSDRIVPKILIELIEYLWFLLTPATAWITDTIPTQREAIIRLLLTFDKTISWNFLK